MSAMLTRSCLNLENLKVPARFALVNIVVRCDCMRGQPGSNLCAKHWLIVVELAQSHIFMVTPQTILVVKSFGFRTKIV